MENIITITENEETKVFPLIRRRVVTKKTTLEAKLPNTEIYGEINEILTGRLDEPLQRLSMSGSIHFEIQGEADHE